MARGKVYIATEGMRAMENDFGLLSTPAPIEHAHERLDVAAENIFVKTQQFVPADKGDKRRPAGALRDSGRIETHSEGDQWTADIRYGTDDDALPYAPWARWKAVGNGKPDYMAPTEDPEDTIGEAMNSAFDDAFGRDE